MKLEKVTLQATLDDGSLIEAIWEPNEPIRVEGVFSRLTPRTTHKIEHELEHALEYVSTHFCFDSSASSERSCTDEIKIGDLVRSYDFETNKDCYIEGVVSGFEEHDGCTRYVIHVKRDVAEGKEAKLRVGIDVYPPVNGTRAAFSLTGNKVTSFVEKIGQIGA